MRSCRRSDVISKIAAHEAAKAVDTSIGELSEGAEESKAAISSSATVTDPAEFGCVTCPHCCAVVVDLEAHTCEAGEAANA